MENKISMAAFISRYQQKAIQLKTTISAKYWDSSKGLFADRTGRDLFSQHANALAILTELVSEKDAKEITQKLLTDNSLAQASIYFKYYLHLAFIKAGYGNDYMS